jgi:hypothetical protein
VSFFGFFREPFGFGVLGCLLPVDRFLSIEIELFVFICINKKFSIDGLFDDMTGLLISDAPSHEAGGFDFLFHFVEGTL